MKVRLVSVGSNAKATEVDVLLPAIVGRGKAATVSLPHPTVSRRHCELYDYNGKLMVRDLGSRNGTFVGNQRVDQSEVPLGELLTIATLSFRVVYGEPSSAPHSDSPLLVSGEESTHGVSDLPFGSKPPPHPARPSREGPVERDTECQRRPAVDRDVDDDGEDLSRLLNGR